MPEHQPATSQPHLPRRGDLITVSDSHWDDQHLEVTAVAGPFPLPDDRTLYGHVPGTFYTLMVDDPANPHAGGWINRVEIYNGQLITGRRHPDLPDARPNHCAHITITGHTSRPFQPALFSA